MEPEAFRPGLYVHYKGGQYRALHLAQHHDTREWLVVYVSMTHGTVNVREWASPGKDSWTDLVEHEGATVPRFLYVHP
jgi:hypothetical protein